MRKNLRGHLTQQPRLIGLRQLLENGIHALPFAIPDGTQSVPRDRPGQRPGHICDDEPERPAADPANDAPELARGAGLPPLGHAFLPQHLLEHAPELLVREGLVVRVRAPVAALAEEVAPVVGGGRAACGAGDLLLGVVAIAAEIVVRARGVVVSAAGGVRERVVGVVDLLEGLCAGGAFGRVGGDAVGVRFEGLSVRGDGLDVLAGG